MANLPQSSAFDEHMNAKQILETLTAPVRACAACEQEAGILDRSDFNKSHGTCVRHFVEFAKQAGESDTEIEKLVAEMGPEAFVPDLRGQ